MRAKMRNPPYQPYHLTMPIRRSTAAVFSSPHSGRAYGRAFRRAAAIGLKALRSSEDAFVDMLFDTAPAHGAPLLSATAPRAWLDLNRGSDELDPALIRGVRSTSLNPRITSGLGVIPRVVSGGRGIYRGKISLAEAEARIREYWHPYHAMLSELLQESHAQFGQALLIDCHSMPHEALHNLCRHERYRPEVVLGDRFGSSASAWITDRIEAAFVAAGLRVARNKPFAGAFIAQHYGRPSQGQHVVQIEIDRALYMNERELRPNGNFRHLKALLDAVIGEIAALGQEKRPLAAE